MDNEATIADRRKITELSGALADFEKKLAASGLECEKLNDRLSFIARVIEAEPEVNSGLEEFRRLLDNDYQTFASQNSFHSCGARALKTLQEVGTQLELVSRDSQIMGKTIIAIGGAFSSGKSSFMNSLFSQDKVSLPVGMDQTTAIASYILQGDSTEITGYTFRGARVAIPEKIFSQFTYRNKDGFRLNMKLIIDDIVFKTGFVQPYENICFVDTPGFNPGASSEQDCNTAITAIAGAQALLWCFDVSGGTIHDDDFTVLQDILNVNQNIRIYIIANRADLKSPRENVEILRQAETLLKTNSIAYEGISLYTSRQKFSSQPDEYIYAVKGKSLEDFLSENNTPDTSKEEDLLKLVRGVFDEFVRADDELISDTDRKIKEAKSISSVFQYVLGKKDEIISDLKSRTSQKELQRMGTDILAGTDGTENDADAVTEFMDENMRVLQETLRKATADKSAAEKLCRKFMESIGSVFDDREIIDKLQFMENSKDAQEAGQDDQSMESVDGNEVNQGSPEADSGENTQSSPVRKHNKLTQSSDSSSVLDDVPDGADSHRHFYRGEDITAGFDDGSFSANIADGSFYDIFPGDYIVKKITVPGVANTGTSTYEVKFVIADLDAAMNHGSPSVTTHHAVIVPETPVFDTYMNPTDTNAGGYAGSYMHKTVMPAFALGLIGAFGTEHLLKCSFDGSGRTSDPLACTCRLMTLSMVFGQAELPSNSWDWSYYVKDKCMGGEQLAAFSLHPELRGQNMWYWVSDLPSSSPPWSSSNFARVRDLGDGVAAFANYASRADVGVRPFALLV